MDAGSPRRRVSVGEQMQSMQKPTAMMARRIVRRLLVPLFHPDYRRLLLRSYVLSARLELLSAVSAVILPFATPSLLRLLRRQLQRLREDVAAFGRMSREPALVPRVQVVQRIRDAAEFRNPWT
jgi:hypothetical protein